MSKAAVLIGLVLVVFGVRMLTSGHAPVLVARAFRTPREAGAYHLLFGVAVLIFAFGVSLLADLAATAAALLSIGLVAFAVVRFRPQIRRR